ncbi:beta strand repeat-containing protein [Novosphingopyxis iocasae]|uniref:beta strand repeat-containing protein n=1 Tax=Novosphingopyxis iocasae TaxID=2762729 RepID=UPI001651A1AB|nr:calcium-binding protein [Novosphingopyxis iocasae]
MATYVGTGNADTITPTQFPALDGADDSIIGNGGDDTLNGGSGNDTITGDAGDDSLMGAAGNDSINGGEGNDLLNGGTGADTMTGGAGDDTYVVDGLGDIINEANGAGTDALIAGGSYVLGSGVYVENLSLATAANSTTYGISEPGNGSYLIGNEVGGQTLTGNDFANTLDGGRNTLGAAGDTLIGGAGNDTFAVRNPTDQVQGGAGNDVVYVDAASLVAGGQIVASWDASNTLAGTNSTGIETISAADQSGTAALNLTGNADAQIIAGNMGANVLNGGGGADTLIGLGGNDTYVVDAAASGAVVIQEAGNGGNDTLNLTGTTGNFNLSTNSDTASIETIKVTNADYTGTITGNSLGQTINASVTGNAATGGPVTLNGGGGADTLIGGAGSDTFRVDSADDVIQDSTSTDNNATNETNAVEFLGKTGGFDLADGVNVTSITATAATEDGNVYLVGNGYNQTITGNAGNNVLDGGNVTKATDGTAVTTQGDTLDGGAGNDVYRIYTANDRVIDASGTDVIYTSAATTNLAVVANGSAIETLSAFDQSSSSINYTLTGDANAQAIIGAMGNDTLAGGGGKDTLIGLGGNDTYNVTANATATDNSVIQEAAGGGNDILNLTGNNNYTLAKNVEIERINLDNSFNGTGVMGGRTVTGNETSQVIDGANAAGPVTLNGGGGTDTLIGGTGNDTFVVDDASDVIIDTKGGPNSISFAGTGGYDLAAGVNVDNLSVATSVKSGVYLVGNEFSQVITGGAGNDVLNGDGGLSGALDTLRGGAGDDVYRVWNSNDRVVESAGNGFDTVYTSVNYSLATNDANNVADGAAAGTVQQIEQLSAADQSSTDSLTLYGNDAANRIIGNNGANILSGGAGQDVLIGLGGADTFVFQNYGAGNADTIQDFSKAEGDKFQLVDGASTTDFNGLMNGSSGTLDASQFVSGTETTSAAGTAQIVYDQSTGRIFFDADGAGGNAAALVAQVTPGTELTANDFTVVSAAPQI